MVVWPSAKEVKRYRPILTPFPATPLYRELESAGRITTRDWSLYDGQHVVFRPATMSAEELQRGTGVAWRRAYSLPGMWSRLRRTAAPWMTALTTNLGYRYYAHHLDTIYTCDALIPAALEPTRPEDEAASDIA